MSFEGHGVICDQRTPCPDLNLNKNPMVIKRTGFFQLSSAQQASLFGKCQEGLSTMDTFLCPPFSARRSTNRLTRRATFSAAEIICSDIKQPVRAVYVGINTHTALFGQNSFPPQKCLCIGRDSRRKQGERPLAVLLILFIVFISLQNTNHFNSIISGTNKGFFLSKVTVSQLTHF